MKYCCYIGKVSENRHFKGNALCQKEANRHCGWLSLGISTKNMHLRLWDCNFMTLVASSDGAPSKGVQISPFVRVWLAPRLEGAGFSLLIYTLGIQLTLSEDEWLGCEISAGCPISLWSKCSQYNLYDSVCKNATGLSFGVGVKHDHCCQRLKTDGRMGWKTSIPWECENSRIGREMGPRLFQKHLGGWNCIFEYIWRQMCG